MRNWVGKRLGKVRIESLVARGGVAEIYVGTHTTLEHKVAVKILRNLSDDNSDALIRFQREARVVAKLRHPNIVQVHDFDTVDNDPYLVMEYIDGPSLSKYLNNLHQNNGRLELPQVIRLLNAVAGALQYAHNNGVIHRDIKPGNILLISASSPIVTGKPLPEDFEPVLTDFGLVRFLDSHRETTTGHIAGTPAYMSPEQARGETTDARTDVYSLGIVLYEILAGHIPFDGETTMSILFKQVTEPPSPIPGLSPAIQDVLNRALAKDVKERFQTPLEFARAFSAAVKMDTDPDTIQSTKEMVRLPEALPATKTASSPPSNRRPGWVRIALLGIMILAIALSGFYFVNGFPASPAQASTPSLPSATDAVPSITSTGAQSASFPLGPIAILRFDNGTALADRATLIARAMPAPPPGSQYEIWLSNADGHISLGNFFPDNTGKGELQFSEPEGLNLISIYDKVEISIEPNPDSDAEQSGLVGYSFTFAAEGLTHVRYLLSSFPNTPNQNALIQGLYSDIKNIDELARDMKTAYESGDKPGSLKKGEEALNLLAGAQGGDHKDWDRSGKIDDASDGYGLLLNGSSFGYIQAVYAEADYTVSTAGATQFMIENGEVVKTCAQNLAQWTPQLHSLLLAILTSTPDSENSGAMRDLVTLSGQLLHGIDLDKNGKVDGIPGECGAETAYEYAYYMADMPILPIGISYQLTGVAGSTPSPGSVVATNTRQVSQNTPAPNTARPRSTKKPNPTKKPPKNNGHP